MRFAFALLSTTLLTLAACPGGGGDTDTDTSTSSGPATSTDATTTSGATTTTAPTTTAPTTGPTTGDEPVACDDAIPDEGTACAVEGEICQFETDLCMNFVGAKCQDGAWVYFDNVPPPECGEGACDPPNFPEEGMTCSPEGASCSTDCSDQCSFCNSWVCQGGLWQHFEVFPAPCLECDAICDFVIVPMCAGGPPDKAACVTGCEENKVGDCKAEFSALRACAGEQPTFTCDMSGRPEVAGCEDKFTAFYACAMP
ncbi:hypothetical protein [Nannocystis sp. SCPEA4]|uniref:hypothetical protein n=1 Tax=Nannocystis sp. SCPEA4 TaxID=2996787 RepID=UPI0022716CF9|nr:hypothetical protein [Nannocystis sp. SCPEA4]MCY1054035.1 hypothetical protein [Nannocystis sp. SCPEA4]